jgi:aspartate 1-decarboxylase
VVIIACFCLADAEELENWQPSLVYVDGANRIAYRKAA